MVPDLRSLYRGVTFIAIVLLVAGDAAAQTTASTSLPIAGSVPVASPPAALLSPVLPGPRPRDQQSPNPPAAQSKPKPSLEREFFKNILRDQKAIWTWPLHIRGEQARWLLPLAGGTAALIATDRYTAEDGGEFNINTTHQAATKDISYLGDIYGVAGVAGSFYLVGRIADNPKARETGVLVAEAAADGAVVAQILKYITERPRPGSDSGHGGFFDGGNSFPSGHATVAWSMAAVVAHEYKGHRWVAITAYGLASLVAAARFGAHEHFLSDVLFGSAIGYGIGRHVYNAHHDPDLDSEVFESKASAPWKSMSRIALAPCYDPTRRQYGLSASLKF